jgi:HEAT repeat protein
MLREAMKPLDGASLGHQRRSADLQSVRDHSHAILMRLRRAATGTDVNGQASAQRSLDRLGLADANAGLELVRRARGPKARAETIEWLHPPLMAWRLVPALLDRTGDEDTTVRVAVARKLGEMAPETVRVVPALISLVNDPDAEVRKAALWSLGCLETEAEAAIPVLLETVRNKADGDLRSHSATALGRIGKRKPEVVMPALLEVLQDTEARGGAVFGIQFIGPAAEDAVEPLIEIVKNTKGDEQGNDSLTSRFAIGALGSIGPKATAAVPTALKMLRERHQGEVRRNDAYMLLCFIGPGAEAAVPDVVQALEKSGSEDKERLWMVNILKNIGPKAKRAVPALMACVLDAKTPGQLREAAVLALEQIDLSAGSEMRATLPRKESIDLYVPRPQCDQQ